MFKRAFGQLAPWRCESKPGAHDKGARGKRRHKAALTTPGNDSLTAMLDVLCRVSVLSSSPSLNFNGHEFTFSARLPSVLCFTKACIRISSSDERGKYSPLVNVRNHFINTWYLKSYWTGMSRESSLAIKKHEPNITQLPSSSVLEFYVSGVTLVTNRAEPALLHSMTENATLLRSSRFPDCGTF